MKKVSILLTVLISVFFLISCSKEEEFLGTEEFVIGTVEGNVYENEYLGLGIKFDSSWTFKTRSELDALRGVTIEFMDDEYVDAAKNSNSYTDMMASDEANMNSINVSFTYFPHKQVMSADVSAILKESFTVIESAYSNIGANDVSYELTTVEIDGKEFDAMEVVAEFPGITLKQLCVGVKCYEHIATIAITVGDGTPTEDYLSNFYVLK